MKIALVYPPCAEVNLKGYPLGLAYLSAALKSTSRFEVDVYNYNGREYRSSLKCFLDIVRKTTPDVVAISFNSFNRKGAYYLLKRIKSIRKETVVILGGVHPSTLHNQLFTYFNKSVDFVIQSEGEVSLTKLCNALKAGDNYKDISGLVYKDEKGEIAANPVTGIVSDLDDLPIPDFSYAADEIKKKGLAYLITSRGCPVNCTFCSTSSFWGQKVRMYSPERVGEEVEYVKSLGAKRVFFHDDTFNLGIERILKITDILKKLDIEYVVQCRVKPVNEEIIAKLVESGCRHISWGVESLSDTILKKINKKITKEDVKKAFDICAEYTDKLTTSAYCCVGIPGETEETINETIDNMNQLIKSTDGPAASMLYILPGTQIHEELVEKGQFDESLWIRSGSVYYYTREHSIHKLNKWRKQINRSGIKIPHSTQNFWDTIPEDTKKEYGIIRRFNKAYKKLKRCYNLLCSRY